MDKLSLLSLFLRNHFCRVNHYATAASTENTWLGVASLAPSSHVLPYYYSSSQFQLEQQFFLLLKGTVVLYSNLFISWREVPFWTPCALQHVSTYFYVLFCQLSLEFKTLLMLSFSQPITVGRHTQFIFIPYWTYIHQPTIIYYNLTTVSFQTTSLWHALFCSWTLHYHHNHSYYERKMH